MLDKFSNYQSHVEYFAAKGFDISKPGFYDHPRFIALERTNPNLLDNYASFIDQKVFSENYLDRAETIIEKAALLLYKELQSDGRKGACVDASMTLSRILEMEGVWNYQVKGSLSITFPPHMGLHRKTFWSVAPGDFTAAHSWLVAPPYKVVDVAVREQPYNEGEEKVLPSVILGKSTEPSALYMEDIIEPKILTDIRRKFGYDESKIMNFISPNLESFTRRFKPEVYQKDGIYFKYSSTGVLAPDLPFEKTISLKLNGRYGIEIYNQIIEPALHSVPS